jgi:hypothetical protein
VIIRFCEFLPQSKSHSRHTRLPGNTSGNDDQVGTPDSVDGALSLLILGLGTAGASVGKETGDLRRGRDVRKIGSDLNGKRRPVSWHWMGTCVNRLTPTALTTS